MIADSDSLLAPFVVGTNEAPRGRSSMGNALIAAARAVPRTYVPARYRGPGVFSSWENDDHMTYLVHALVAEDSEYSVYAGFFLKPGPKADQNGAAPIEHWCVGLRIYSTDPFGFFGDDVERVGVLETLRVRVGRDGFEGATELALLRQCWLRTLRCGDSGLVVHGGTDQWSDAWAETLNDVTIKQN